MGVIAHTAACASATTAWQLWPCPSAMEAAAVEMRLQKACLDSRSREVHQWNSQPNLKHTYSEVNASEFNTLAPWKMCIGLQPRL